LEAMMPFHELFPEIGLSETRSARVLQNDKKLPADSYGFVELFCVDPKCDCRDSGRIEHSIRMSTEPPPAPP